jgi:uncharacterized protein YecE (DUF72 family)
MNRQPELFDFGEDVPPAGGEAAPAMALTMPETLSSLLHVGACSWKYDSWKGLLYTPGREYGPFDYLPDYARYLKTVEIDQWFWSLFPGAVKLPDPDTVRRYADSVPDDFIFTVKAPNAVTLTHHYARQPKAYADWVNRPNGLFLDPDLMRRFLDCLSPMHTRLGPVMLQFEYLNRRKMPSRSEFLDRLNTFLARLPPDFRYAVETRNPDYLTPDLARCLGEHSVGCVLVDGYHMPPVDEALHRLGTQWADIPVVRLIGPDRSGIEKANGKRWNQIVQPMAEGLDAVARIVLDNVACGRETFVNVNNH